MFASCKSCLIFALQIIINYAKFLELISPHSICFSLKNFIASLSLVLKYDKRDGRGFVPVWHIQSSFGDVIRRYYDRYSCELSNNGICSRGRKNPRPLFSLFLPFLSFSLMLFFMSQCNGIFYLCLVRAGKWLLRK